MNRQLSTYVMVLVLLVTTSLVLCAESSEPERFQLDNGLAVIVRPIRGATQVAMVVLFSIGGDHDPEGRSGLAHLIEHLYVTAGAGGHGSRTIDEYVARYSAGWNAQTGDRYTVIATVFPPERLEEELSDASARMGELRATPADFERERPRLLEELDNMFGRVPMLAAMNHARELLRPSPQKGRKGGLPDHLKAITVEEVQARLKSYYKPANALIVVAGAVDGSTVHERVKKHFGGLPSGEPVPAPKDPGQAAFGSVKEMTVRPLMPQATAQACLAYAAPVPTGELYAPFLVLVARMWQEVGAQRASEKQVQVMFAPLDDPAALTVSTAIAKDETPKQALARLEAFVEGVLKSKLRENEPAGVKNGLGWMLGIADVPDVFFAQNPYGLAFLVGRRKQLGVDPATLKKAVESMTDEALDRAKKEIFGPDRHTGACVMME